MSSPVKALAAIFCVLLIACGSEDIPVPEASLEATAATPQRAGADGKSENAGPELGSFGVDLSHQDPDIRPGMTFSATPMVNGWTVLSCRPAAATMGRLRF